MKIPIVVILFMGISFGGSFSKADDGGILPSDTTECSTNRDAYCSFWCSLDDPQYVGKYDKIVFTHYTTNIKEPYTFTDNDGVECVTDTTSGAVNISITLPTVYSGYYTCAFYVNGLTELKDVPYYTFDFAATPPGLGIGEECDDASQCLAVFAYCDTFNATSNDTATCNCHGDYSVDFTDDIYTPACVEPANFDDNCQSDNQCSAISYMSCINGKCGCSKGYSRDETSKICVVNSDDGLSPGAIAGIVIGSIAGVAIICGIIYFIVK